jgi:hypothetical protein
MPAAEYNIRIDQGSDYAISLVISEAGVVKDLTGYLGRAQMRPAKKSNTVSGSFVVDIPTPLTGAVVMSLPNATSTGMTPAKYYYDLEIYTAGDADVIRLLKGTSTVDTEVTRP